MFPGETLLTGAPPKCDDCKVTPPLSVMRSPAGWYIGSVCQCGPYSRESEYYPTNKAAEGDLLVFIAYQKGKGPMPKMARS
jgi:hypothetical protein